NLLEEIITARFPRDFKCESGGAWVNHRRIGQRDVYMVQNAPNASWCFFRVQPNFAVQRWDAWSGNREVISENDIERQKDGIRVRLPSEGNSCELIVFGPKQTVDESLSVYRRFNDLSVRKIEGSWESELLPTLDNTFGDFRLPAPKKGEPNYIGAEARRFRNHSEYEMPKTAQKAGSSPKDALDWTKPDFDDAGWDLVTAGFETTFLTYPVPENASDKERKEWEQALITGQTLSLKGVPYRMSWRYGLEKYPGDQEGYHGLKEIISDDFIRVETASERAPVYFVSNIVNDGTATSSQDGKARANILICDGKHEYKIDSNGKSPQETCMKPSAVWVNGKPVNLKGDLKNAVELEKGVNRVLIKFESPGRSHVVFENAENQSGVTTAGPTTTQTRTPLATQWFDNKRCFRFISNPVESRNSVPAELFRFTAPPGLSKITFWTTGRPAGVYVDGKELVTSSDSSNTHNFSGVLDTCSAKPPVVAVRIIPESTLNSDELPRDCTELFDVKLTCEKGEIEPGDWSKLGVLETYSGGIWYRKKLNIDESELKADRIMLDLGKVVASAEVRINGKLAGVLTTSPWKVDITKLLKPGENKIEVLVMSTLANHYQTIPSDYKGNPTAGLLGPVQLILQKSEK
ncbi:MAG: glycosylhydrolase-like jelly roll fold domain-containing protein, partial [Thermoguttaceae bacterium]